MGRKIDRLEELTREVNMLKRRLVASPFVPLPQKVKVPLLQASEAIDDVTTEIYFDILREVVDLTADKKSSAALTLKELAPITQILEQHPTLDSEQTYIEVRNFNETGPQTQIVEDSLAKISGTRGIKFPKKSRATKTGFGSGRFQSQFAQQGFKLPRKRSKKEKASDKKLSAAFKKANSTCRKKNGQFKKGKCQADVAKMAHRLRKKM